MIVVAANPYRGAARPRARVETLVTALAAAGRRLRVEWDAEDRAVLLGDPGAMADVRCVVAAGGDGTVAAVLNALGGDVPLAVLPLTGYAWAVIRARHRALSHVRGGGRVASG